MRVLMLASHFPRPTNPSMGVWALTQAQALRRAGAEVEVIAMCDWVPRGAARVSSNAKLRSRALCPASWSWEGLRVEYPRWPRYHAGPHAGVAFAHPRLELRPALAISGRRIGAIASAYSPDLIYAHGSVINGEIGRRLRGDLHVPLVCHDHDHGEIRACQQLPARRRHLAQICAAAETNIVVSCEMRDLMLRVVPTARIAVVPNGADPDPDRAPRTGATVLCVAGFYPRKRIPDLVEAFAIVAANDQRARLRIIGDGPDRARVQAAVARHRLTDRVTLLGERPHGEVLEEMRRAAVFALLSSDEPFGVVYLESLAAGVPVVCTDEAGVTDVIADQVHGRIVPLAGGVSAAADAITTLLGDDAARLRMGEAGRALVEDRLSWDANAQAVTKLFRSAIDCPPPEPVM